ncbi:MAG: tyrosine-type recombinase/integrase [Lachnospiraceae bacterium]|nr:tyrosine-type recombinase/integrase [Lachnospiraceae bacterium]
MTQPYYKQVDLENTKKLRELIADLPSFVGTFFRGIDQQTASRTKISYAYDLRIFFQYLKENNPIVARADMKSLTVDLLDQITALDLEEYMEYLKYYTKDGTEYTNSERGIKRKLSCLKTFYNYFYQKEMIRTNPAALVKLPKMHEKAIIRLEADEVSRLLDQVEQGDKLTKGQRAFHEQTKERDLAIMTLLLGTGIRVSECVGLDIGDVDMKEDAILIHRKGGKEAILYFGNEVEEALLPYLAVRKEIEAVEGHENALFLSMQKKRMSVRAVENLVKKYTRTAAPLKKITPHKLRSTYGTSLYKETGDIYLVASVLGHSDVNTTKKHYAAMDEEQRRRARNAVHLRKD